MNVSAAVTVKSSALYSSNIALIIMGYTTMCVCIGSPYMSQPMIWYIYLCYAGLRGPLTDCNPRTPCGDYGT